MGMRRRIGRAGRDERAQFGQHAGRPRVPQRLAHPLLVGWGQEGAIWPAGLPDGREVLRRVRQIEDAHRLGTVIVNKGLAPLRSIHHGTDPPRPCDPPPVEFPQGKVGNGGTIGQPRTV